jgi:hypothetical protein
MPGTMYGRHGKARDGRRGQREPVTGDSRCFGRPRAGDQGTLPILFVGESKEGLLETKPNLPIDRGTRCLRAISADGGVESVFGGIGHGAPPIVQVRRERDQSLGHRRLMRV